MIKKFGKIIKMSSALGLSAMVLTAQLPNVFAVEEYIVMAEEGELVDLSTEGVAFVDDIADCEYTGSEITPSVKVTVGDVVLEMDKDYTLSFKNNVEITDEAVVKITGKGNYKGTIEKNFRIIPVSIAKTKIMTSNMEVYTGKAIKPSVMVRMNGKTLTEGVDYTVAYENNINVGTASIIVTGKGMYGGTVTKTFKILKTGNKIVKYTSYKKIKYKKLKKKKQKFYINAVGKGGVKVGYSFFVKHNTDKVNKYFKVSSKGKVTIKRRAKKGTYKLKVMISLAENSNYNKALILKTITVRIK